MLPHRTQLLQGLLASHVIGFHLFEYARHFMTSCRRLLALGENVGAGPAGGVLSIDLGSRRATITVSHVGIDCEVIRHRLGQPEVAQQREALVNKRPDLRGRTILGGVEMLNKQQGVALKLLAFEQLLAHQLAEISPGPRCPNNRPGSPEGGERLHLSIHSGASGCHAVGFRAPSK